MYAPAKLACSSIIIWINPGTQEAHNFETLSEYMYYCMYATCVQYSKAFTVEYVIFYDLNCLHATHKSYKQNTDWSLKTKCCEKKM